MSWSKQQLVDILVEISLRKHETTLTDDQVYVPSEVMFYYEAFIIEKALLEGFLVVHLNAVHKCNNLNLYHWLTGLNNRFRR